MTRFPRVYKACKGARPGKCNHFFSFAEDHLRKSLAILLVLIIGSAAFVACSGSQSPTTSPTAATTATSITSGHPSTSFQLAGLGSHPGTFTLANLQAVPKVTVTINAKPLGAHSFGGALLYSLLQQAGIVTVSTRKNDILRKAVLITGTDGYGAAVSLSEIIPRFANKQVILAYEEDGKPLPQTDGFTRLVVPRDAFAGRYVSNVAQVAVLSPGPIPKIGASTPSSAFYLDGQAPALACPRPGGYLARLAPTLLASLHFLWQLQPRVDLSPKNTVQAAHAIIRREKLTNSFR